MTNETAYQALARRAERTPERLAFGWLEGGELIAELSYAQLYRRVELLARGLRECTRHGDRVLLALEPGLDFLAVFFACLHVGRIAVPIALPRGRESEARRRAAAVHRQCGATLAVVPARLRNGHTDGGATPGLIAGVDFYVTPDELEERGAARGGGDVLEPHPVALLQYTSGSTALPKGVIVDHANLADNSLRMRERYGFNEETRGLSWLPPHHDMGLIGAIVQPLCTGFPVLLMSPTRFVQRPMRWLEAISKYRITTSGGPCFAYDLCVRRAHREQIEQLDLRTWSVAFIGAETVRADVMRAFAQTFALAGLQAAALTPCYGMAEATLMISAQRPGNGVRSMQLCRDAFARGEVRPPAAEPNPTQAAMEVVSCGPVVDEHTASIVDPETRRRLPPGHIGEVWLSGPSVAQGYFGDPGATSDSFAARLADGDGRQYLRTGDQAFVHGGELYICGRLKALIVIRGRNYAPEDVERLLQNDQPALARHAGVAFAVDGETEESLVVVHEIDRRHLDDDLAAICRRVQRLLGQQLGLKAADVMLVRPGTIPRTTSGKLQRIACRRLYLEGRLPRLRQATAGQRATTSAQPDQPSGPTA